MDVLPLTTPALLFPTVSLLLLAYTNRYVAISNRIRTLHALYKENKSDVFIQQIAILKTRIRLIRDMQLMGILSIFTSAFTMFLIYSGFGSWAAYIFTTSLLLLMTSLGLSAYEIILSNKALYIQIKDIEDDIDGLNDGKGFHFFH